MTLVDLLPVGRWLREPHVARWFIPESTAEKELAKYRKRIERPNNSTVMCTVELDRLSIGWCQWYRWRDYPEAAEAVGAREGEVGADYAIGNPDVVGHGIGTDMIRALVDEVRHRVPTAGLLVAPEFENRASCRVLEKNGFALVEIRPVKTEPHNRPMAIYRLAAS